MNTQFKKGVLEILVLALLDERDRYGFELVENISKNIDISEGTIYPLLKKLHTSGYVETYLVESSSGPPRKYYKISENGKNLLIDQLVEWKKFSTEVNNILGDVYEKEGIS